jgi:hypothetical protein
MEVGGSGGAGFSFTIGFESMDRSGGNGFAGMGF